MTNLPIETIETIKVYQGNDAGVRQRLVTLEDFIGDMDGAELADDSAVDTSDAVTAINGLIWSLEQRDAEIGRLTKDRDDARWAIGVKDKQLIEFVGAHDAAVAEIERLRATLKLESEYRCGGHEAAGDVRPGRGSA